MAKKGYCEVTDIEAYTLKEVRADFESNVELWIEAMENFIERFTGRVFIADSEASVRYLDGNGKSEIFIDECISVESVKVNDIYDNLLYNLAEEDYKIYPYNELPIRKLLLKPSSECLEFERGNGNIEVEANWGSYEEVPADIKLACIILVSGIVNFSNNADGEVKSEKIGDYQVTYKDNQWENFNRAKEILNSILNLMFRKFPHLITITERLILNETTGKSSYEVKLSSQRCFLQPNNDLDLMQNQKVMQYFNLYTDRIDLKIGDRATIDNVVYVIKSIKDFNFGSMPHFKSLIAKL